MVYLSSILPLDDAGAVIGPGDIVAQTRAIYARAERVLGAIGLGLDRVVKTLDYLTPAALTDYKYTGRVRRERLGPVYPGAAGIIMPRLVHPEAMMQVDFIAVRDAPVAVNPGWTRYEKLTYSPAVRAGNLLFMAGQGSLDPETERVVHDGDVVAQAEYTYENILQGGARGRRRSREPGQDDRVRDAGRACALSRRGGGADDALPRTLSCLDGRAVRGAPPARDADRDRPLRHPRLSEHAWLCSPRSSDPGSDAR